jgi:phosphotransferase system enzyme I (PtsI)
MEEFPSEENQYARYRMLADRLYPHKVTIRTFDVGGDKLLPEAQKETNPFLGWRGIRICLDKPDIFLDQLRAILRASSRGNVKIMFPMISSLDEILETKKLLNAAKVELKKKKMPFDENIKIGIMVEVPSAVFMADEFAKEVDFFSIGTNDLVQYILAVDRDSSVVASYYQKFHPAVVHALDYIVESAARNKIDLSICGEMAGDPLGSLLLIGLGIKELSVETTSFLRIKRLIRMLKYSDAKKIAEKALTMNTEAKIKELLSRSFEKIIKELQQ